MGKIIVTLALAILGGVAYRMGGSGNYPRYFRELGQGLCVVASMIVFGMIHWSLVLCFGVCWAESTYFKRKGTDAKPFNWVLVGLVFALIPLPYCVATNSHWLGLFIRACSCIVWVVLWQEVLSEMVFYLLRKRFGKDVLDEFGRGFINVSALWLLLIGA